MTDFSTVKKNLETRGFQVSTFQTAAEAADYLNAAMDGVSVGFGGSITLDQMGLYEKLRTHNDVVWHWKTDDKLPARYRAMTTDMYVTSVNGLAETGELVNIDGIGNRVAGTLFGHRKVWFVVGRNKLAPTYEEALWRARNIAALFFAWVSSALRASLGENVFLFFNLQLLRLICLLANPAFS